jgi:GT2 family glycosyltransferase
VSSPEPVTTPAIAPGASPIVSVVVPTRGRPELLARCLAALRTQTLSVDRYEVIVADDGPDAETAAVARAAARDDGAPIRYLAVTGRHGPAAARNAGWRAARGAVIAFTDDDCIPWRGWLAAGLTALAEDLDAVAGQVIVPRPDRPTDHQRSVSHLETAEFVTASCFCRRAALEMVGGFDEAFPAAWREDSDLQFALLERGARLGTAPAAVVIHPVRPARWGVSLREQRKSMFNALLYRKHPALYRERIQATPPWRYYAIVAALGAIAVGGAARRPRLAAAGAAGWVALTAGFCRARLHGTSRAPAHVAEMAVTSMLIPPLAVGWRLLGALRYRVFFA